jgi:acetoin utilization protein AcuB
MIPAGGKTMDLVASDVMTPSPRTIRVSTTIGQALEILQSLDVRHLPVVNADREVVGMVSDRDFRGLPIPNLYQGSHIPLRAPVSEIMSSDVISVEEETAVKELIDLMIDNKLGAVPVVDGDDVLVGIVSYVDLLRELGKDL